MSTQSLLAAAAANSTMVEVTIAAPFNGPPCVITGQVTACGADSVELVDRACGLPVVLHPWEILTARPLPARLSA